MGFRNPITSASAVDSTNGQGSAGVIINGARATWQDGQAGMGYVEALSSSASVVGSKFHAVGSTGGNLSPEWAMTCEGLPAGGYQSVLTVTADVVRVGAPQGVAPIVPPTEPTYPNPSYFTSWAAAGSPTNFYYERDAAGIVNLSGLVRLPGAGNWTANIAMFTLPAGCRPPADRFFVVPTAQSAYTLFLVKVASTGSVYWQGNPGASFTYTAGAWIDFTGVNFRATQ